MITERVRRLLGRKHAYQGCFQEADGETLTKQGADVMRDLARFCGAFKSNLPRPLNGAVDPIAMGVAEGRRQVYLRILAQLNVSEQEILRANEE